jgi:uncharacterized membrane protein YdjX (TVP38/TMEM64 family)
LLVVLVARQPHDYILCVITAALGSTTGVLLMDLVLRKGGEEGLKKIVSPKRFEQLKQKMKKNAAIALVVACLAPPPFPFTAITAAAIAFQYPRQRLLGIVLGTRLVRFALVGLAAMFWGRKVLRMIQTPEFKWFMFGFIAFCLAGSSLSLYRWTRRSSGSGPRSPSPSHAA